MMQIFSKKKYIEVEGIEAYEATCRNAELLGCKQSWVDEYDGQPIINGFVLDIAYIPDLYRVDVDEDVF